MNVTMEWWTAESESPMQWGGGIVVNLGWGGVRGRGRGALLVPSESPQWASVPFIFKWDP